MYVMNLGPCLNEPEERIGLYRVSRDAELEPIKGMRNHLQSRNACVDLVLDLRNRSRGKPRQCHL